MTILGKKQMSEEDIKLNYIKRIDRWRLVRLLKKRARMLKKNP